MAYAPNRLPGSDLVDEGLEDLRAGRETTSAALVRMARPRLRDLGFDVPDTEDDQPAGHALYALLASEDRATAHSRYNALVARMVSYTRSAEHAPPSRR